MGDSLSSVLGTGFRPGPFHGGQGVHGKGAMMSHYCDVMHCPYRAVVSGTRVMVMEGVRVPMRWDVCRRHMDTLVTAGKAV